jgi:hypothetical protein
MTSRAIAKFGCNCQSYGGVGVVDSTTPRSVCTFLSSEETVRGVDEQYRLEARELFLKEFDVVAEAETRFGRLESKFSVYDFPECLAALKYHQRCTGKLKAAVTARSQGREDNVDLARETWWKTENEFREQIVSVFRAL